MQRCRWWFIIDHLCVHVCEWIGKGWMYCMHAMCMAMTVIGGAEEICSGTTTPDAGARRGVDLRPKQSCGPSRPAAQADLSLHTATHATHCHACARSWM